MGYAGVSFLGGLAQGMAEGQQDATKRTYVKTQTDLLKKQLEAAMAADKLAQQYDTEDPEAAMFIRSGHIDKLPALQEFRLKQKLYNEYLRGGTGAAIPAPVQPPIGPYEPGAPVGPLRPSAIPQPGPPMQPPAPPPGPGIPVTQGPQVGGAWNARHVRNIIEKDIFGYTRQPTQVLRNQLRPGHAGPVTVVLDPEDGTELSITQEFDAETRTMTFPSRGRMITGNYVGRKGSTEPIAGVESMPDGTVIPRDFVVTGIKDIPTRDVSDETGAYIEGYDPMDPTKSLYRILKGPPDMTDVATMGGGKTKVPTMSLVPGRRATGTAGSPMVTGPGFRTELDVEDRPVGDKASDWRIGEQIPSPGMSPKKIREAGGRQVSTGYQSREAAFRGAEGIVGQLEKLGYKVFKKRGPLESWFKTPLNAYDMMMNRDHQMYESFRAGVISNIVRTFGEVGTLNEGDIQRAKSLLPTTMPRVVNGVPIPPDDLDSFEQKMTGIKDLISEISQRPKPASPNRPEADMQRAVKEGYVGPGPYRNKKTGQTVQIETVEEFMGLIGGGK